MPNRRWQLTAQLACMLVAGFGIWVSLHPACNVQTCLDGFVCSNTHPSVKSDAATDLDGLIWLGATALAKVRLKVAANFCIRTIGLVHIHEDDISALEGLVLARGRQDRMSEAHALLERAPARHPTNPETREIFDRLQATSYHAPPPR